MQTPQPTTQTFSQHQEAILTSLFQGASRTSACHAAGLPQLYNWIKTDPVFSEAVEEAEAESISVAEDLAYECAMKAIEDPRYLRALFFWLKHRAGWIQARPDPAPAVGARRDVPTSSPEPQPTPLPTHSVGATGPVALPSDSNTPPVDTDDLASVMNLVREYERREREDEEFMRGYEEWKQLSEDEREEIIREEENRTTLGELDLPGDGTPEENPGIRVPSVPSKPSPNPKSAIQNPKSVVPSRKRDRMHQQRFKKKKRR